MLPGKKFILEAVTRQLLPSGSFSLAETQSQSHDHKSARCNWGKHELPELKVRETSMEPPPWFMLSTKVLELSLKTSGQSAASACTLMDCMGIHVLPYQRNRSFWTMLQ